MPDPTPNGAPAPILDPVIAARIAARAEGTCDSVAVILSALNLSHLVTEEDAEAAILDHNLERCPQCEWWTEAGELAGDEDDPDADEHGVRPGCYNCVPRRDREDAP